MFLPEPGLRPEIVTGAFLWGRRRHLRRACHCPRFNSCYRARPFRKRAMWSSYCTNFIGPQSPMIEVVVMSDGHALVGLTLPVTIS